jgi:hypothetical protein
VTLLPYIEQPRLYKRFHLDEPWDSPHNRSLITEIPWIYQSVRGRRGKLPHETGTTPYLAVRGLNSVLNSGKPTRLARSTAIVILVEVDEEHEVVWTKPDDFELAAPDALQQLRVSHGHFLMGFRDRTIQYPAPSLTLEELQAMANRTTGPSRTITPEEASFSRAVANPD